MSAIRLTWTRDSNTPFYLYRSVNKELNLAQLSNPIVIDPRVKFYLDENIDTNNKYYYVFTAIRENKTYYSEVIAVEDFEALNVALKYSLDYSSVEGMNIELKFEV